MIKICKGRDAHWTILRAVFLMVGLGVVSFCEKASAQQTLTIAWDAVTNTATAGYILYYGAQSQNYTNSLNAGTNTSIKVSNLQVGVNYYFAVTAYNTAGVEGTPSAEIVSRTAPVPFLINQSALTTNSQYLQFDNGTPFGFFSGNGFPWIDHQDLGKEYAIDAADGKSGIYLFDLASRHYFYTNPNVYPSLYDLHLKDWVTYYSDSSNPGHYTTGPRYFYNQGTKKVFAM